MRWVNSLSGTSSRTMTADSVIHKVIPVRNFTVLWRNVPIPNWQALDEYQGTVNFKEFLGCAPESLLYLGATTQERVNSAGDVVYDISARFSKKWIPYSAPGGLTAYAGWNYLYRPDVTDPTVDHQWQETSPAIYQSSKFAELFQLGTTNLRSLFMNDVGWKDLSK